MYDPFLELDPLCGAVYSPEKTAGEAVICTREPHDPKLQQHYNDDLKWGWWG